MNTKIHIIHTLENDDCCAIEIIGSVNTAVRAEFIHI